MALRLLNTSSVISRPVNHCTDNEQQPGDPERGSDLDIEGIVLKQGAPTDLPKALAALQKAKIHPGKRFAPAGKISAGGYGDKRLSPKESEVLRLFAEGFPVTEIAKSSTAVSKPSVARKIGDDEARRGKRYRPAQLPLFRFPELNGPKTNVSLPG